MHRIGMLTPSSNTVLEPVSVALLAGVESVTLHFSRFRVTEIALDAAARDQFDDSPMLGAAELLSHAKVDCITWNGTSSSWLGFEADRRLIQRIHERTGIRASTCVLALADILHRHKLARIALVTPYTSDVQARIVTTYAAEGFEIVAERHLGIRDNHAFGLVDGATLSGMVAEVAAEKPDAVVVLCTNLAGAPLVPDLEREHGITVLDSVAVSLYGALKTVGADPAMLQHRGQLFELG